MRWYTIFWASWVAVGIIFELAVLIGGIEDATLSEQVWKLREQRSGFFSLLIFFLAWMIYHFIRENVGAPEVPTLPPPTPVGPIDGEPPTGAP